VTRARRLLVLFLVAGAALAVPAAAFAHAALLATSPSASRIVNVPPKEVRLTYSEPVEPRFAIVSVTDPAANQVTDGPPERSPTNPDQLVVPLKKLEQGWYLVYWRVISADGHPVRGAFTFAVGPNPGPAPQFVIPSISETAATPGLLVARWIVYLLTMAAVGLFVLRMLIAQPVVRRVPGVSLRALAIAFWVATGAALIAIPIYLDMATAKFALRSAFDLGDVVPLFGDSAFGRGYLRLELVMALFALAGGVAIWLDRPERERRPTAALLAFIGALAAGGSLLFVQSLSGHAAQTSPRWLTLLLDWAHFAAGSIWIGGLVGLLVLWVSSGALRVGALAVCVPRFSRVALVSVLVLVGTGIGASLIQFPTFDSLWDTSYGKSLVLKLCFLGGTLAIAWFNFWRTAPTLDRVRSGSVSDSQGSSAASVLRVLVGGEVILLVGAVFGASLLTSLPPPPKALANLGEVNAHVGPGPVRTVVTKNGYRLEFTFSPNRAAVPNTFSVAITKDGKPVRGADVTAKFTMLDMEMGQLAYSLPEREPGVFRRSAPALVMVGHWGIGFDIRPPGGPPLDVLLTDKANG